jgi:hypothetical protein
MGMGHTLIAVGRGRERQRVDGRREGRKEGWRGEMREEGES